MFIELDPNATNRDPAGDPGCPATVDLIGLAEETDCLPAEDRELLLRHVGNCQPCQVRLAELELSWSEAAALPAGPPPLASPLPDVAGLAPGQLWTTRAQVVLGNRFMGPTCFEPRLLCLLEHPVGQVEPRVLAVPIGDDLGWAGPGDLVVRDLGPLGYEFFLQVWQPHRVPVRGLRTLRGWLGAEDRADCLELHRRLSQQQPLPVRLQRRQGVCPAEDPELQAFRRQEAAVLAYLVEPARRAMVQEEQAAALLELRVRLAWTVRQPRIMTASTVAADLELLAGLIDEQVAGRTRRVELPGASTGELCQVADQLYLLTADAALQVERADQPRPCRRLGVGWVCHALGSMDQVWPGPLELRVRGSGGTVRLTIELCEPGEPEQER